MFSTFKYTFVNWIKSEIKKMICFDYFFKKNNKTKDLILLNIICVDWFTNIIKYEIFLLQCLQENYFWNENAKFNDCLFSQTTIISS